MITDPRQQNDPTGQTKVWLKTTDIERAQREADDAAPLWLRIAHRIGDIAEIAAFYGGILLILAAMAVLILLLVASAAGVI